MAGTPVLTRIRRGRVVAVGEETVISSTPAGPFAPSGEGAFPLRAISDPIVDHESMLSTGTRHNC